MGETFKERMKRLRLRAGLKSHQAAADAIGCDRDIAPKPAMRVLFAALSELLNHVVSDSPAKLLDLLC